VTLVVRQDRLSAPGGMPLLVVTGCPSSGKTTIVGRILTEFESRGVVDIIHVSDRDNPTHSTSDYGDFKKEKENRGSLRSAVQRGISKDKLVVCDSLNYIKGFRYELFCTAKNAETTYAVLHANAELDTCRWLNSQRSIGDSSRYSDTILSELVERYERPDNKNRWDSPLYELNISHNEGEQTTPRNILLPIEDLYSFLIMGKPLKANISTQSLTPRAGSSFLLELDTITQKILSSLMDRQRTAIPGDKLMVLSEMESPQLAQNDSNKVIFTRQRNIAELNRLRAQFIRYSKTHPIEDGSRIASLFVDFLNSNP